LPDKIRTLYFSGYKIEGLLPIIPTKCTHSVVLSYKTVTCIESHWPNIRECSCAKQSLNVAIVNAREAKQSLNVAIVNAREAKQSLNVAIVNARETKQSLNVAIVDAREAKQSLNVKLVNAREAKQVYRFKNITERLCKTEPRDCFTQLHYLMVDQ
jgi:hypothetical protein